MILVVPKGGGNSFKISVEVLQFCFVSKDQCPLER